MAHGLKNRKTQVQPNTSWTDIDLGFPNNGTTDNGYSYSYPGVVGGLGEYSNQIECQARIVVVGLGTITATTGSKTVVGVGTHFTTDAMTTGNTRLAVSDGNGGYTYLGVVDSVTDANNLELVANSAAAVSGSAWFYGTESGNSSIIRQKGSRRFLVQSDDLTIQDESIAKGGIYAIRSLGNTDWAALGASINPTAGEVFTASKNGTGLATNGTIVPAGTCILTDASAPASFGQMSISVGTAEGTVYASRIKNHWVLDFSIPDAKANPGATYVATFQGSTATQDPATGFYWSRIENWC